MIGMVLQLFGGRGASLAQMRDNWYWGASMAFEDFNREYGLNAGLRKSFAADISKTFNEIKKIGGIKYVWKDGERKIQMRKAAYEMLREASGRMLDKVTITGVNDEELKALRDAGVLEPIFMSTKERKGSDYYENHKETYKYGNAVKNKYGVRVTSDRLAQNPYEAVMQAQERGLLMGIDTFRPESDIYEQLSEHIGYLRATNTQSFSQYHGYEAYNEVRDRIAGELPRVFVYGRRANTPETDAYRQNVMSEAERAARRRAAARKGWETRRGKK